MSVELFETYVEDILHLVSQNLLVPTIIILLALIIFSLWCIGSIIVEAVTERRHLKVALPDLVDRIDASTLDDFDSLIDDSGLLRRQRVCLHEIVKHAHLPEDSLIALAKRLLADEQVYYDRKTSRTDIATKVAPMFGLMGTLIPLGPGIVALGQNNVTTLSSSLLIAFDTTVAGLLAAAVTYIISRIRKGWYEDYMTTLEAVMTCMLDKILSTSGKRSEGASALGGTDPSLGIGAGESVRQSAAQVRRSVTDPLEGLGDEDGGDESGAASDDAEDAAADDAEDEAATGDVAEAAADDVDAAIETDEAVEADDSAAVDEAACEAAGEAVAADGTESDFDSGKAGA